MTTTDARCPNGHLVPARAAFCTQCGATVTPGTTPWATAPPATVTARCANGHPVAAGAAFCTSCGARVAAVGAYAHRRERRFSALAVASLVVSLVWLYGLTSGVAVLLAIRALSRIDPARERGRGLAIAAIVLGALGLVLALAVGAARR
jgi:hypothetical protein